MKTQRCSSYKKGFTLVELLIIVVMIGILAAIVIPCFADATVETQQNAFASNLKSFSEAAMVYEAKMGEFPGDGGSGTCPAGLEDYIDEVIWARPTPVGGVWDTENNDTGGVEFALGVHFNDGSSNNNDTYMTEVDLLVDDGDLTTGSFRKLAAGRYYLVISD